MIALILATKNDVSPGYSKSTLIGMSTMIRFTPWLKHVSVVPLSVLSNWEKQIQDHCVPDTLSYAVYYGATRNMSATELQKYDVIVTTYQTVVGELGGSEETVGKGKKRKKDTGSLFGVPWKVPSCSTSATGINADPISAYHSRRRPQYQEPQDEDGAIRVRA
jgi:SWI/SNF-related matrix-associated actin-dependent regulator of chromatin subfamily A3